MRTGRGRPQSPTLTRGAWSLPQQATPPFERPPSPAGKKHILVLSQLRTEDAGEVRFQAGPAQSLTQLEVEGEQWEWERPGRDAVRCSETRQLPSCPPGTVLGRVRERHVPREEELLGCGAQSAGVRQGRDISC